MTTKRKYTARETAHPAEKVDTVLPRPCPCPAMPKHDSLFTGEEQHSATADKRWRIYRCSHDVVTLFEIPLPPAPGIPSAQ